jgi:lysophospholipid acyltransferase (LPLAT)-like uncharacterized protein
LNFVIFNLFFDMVKKFIRALGLFLVRVVSRTWRISAINPPQNMPAVITFWHGYMMPVWKYFSFGDACAVVSSSHDGQILSDLLGKWKFNLIRGSSSRGGGEVLLKVVNNLPTKTVLITPDGPRGPRYGFKVGALVASQRTSRPLYYCGVDIHGYKSFHKSWDRFLFPHPFAKITLRFSDPVHVPVELSREEITRVAETASEDMKQLYSELL